MDSGKPDDGCGVVKGTQMGKCVYASIVKKVTGTGRSRKPEYSFPV